MEKNHLLFRSIFVCAINQIVIKLYYNFNNRLKNNPHFDTIIKRYLFPLTILNNYLKK